MKSTKRKFHNSVGTGKEAVNRKTSIIFMQLGLVMALFFTYMAIESSTEVTNEPVAAVNVYNIDEEFPPEIHIEKPKVEEPKKKEPEPEPIVDIINPDVVNNDVDVKKIIINTTDSDEDQKVKIKPDDVPYIPIPEPDTPESFSKVEFAPTFPGCKGTKEEIKKCFNASIQKFVGDKFNAELSQELGLNSGKIRINVQFVVGKTGEIQDVLVKAPHKKLEKEARRVVELLPKIKPGIQGGKPVGVRFNLPIILQVEEF